MATSFPSNPSAPREVKHVEERGNGIRLIHYTDGSVQQICTIPVPVDTRTEEEKAAIRNKEREEQSWENFQKADKYAHARRVYAKGEPVMQRMVEHVAKHGPCYTQFEINADLEEHAAIFHLADRFASPDHHIGIEPRQELWYIVMYTKDHEYVKDFKEKWTRFEEERRDPTTPEEAEAELAYWKKRVVDLDAIITERDRKIEEAKARIKRLEYAARVAAQRQPLVYGPELAQRMQSDIERSATFQASKKAPGKNTQ